jgi:hypothetical protein
MGEQIEQFSEEEIKMTNKYMKKCSSLARKETQINTTLGFHLTPVRLTIIRETNNKRWGGGGEAGIF